MAAYSEPELATALATALATGVATGLATARTDRVHELWDSTTGFIQGELAFPQFQTPLPITKIYKPVQAGCCTHHYTKHIVHAR